MILTLTDKESKVFYETINSELRCCINEYDDDTGRRPSVKRIKDSKYAESIIEKWEKTQNIVPGTTFINLDTINACKLDLTDKEVRYGKNLLDKSVKAYRKALSPYPAPYTGIFKCFKDSADTTDDVLIKLAC